MPVRLNVARLNPIAFHHVSAGVTLSNSKEGRIHIGFETVGFLHHPTRFYMPFIRYRPREPEVELASLPYPDPPFPDAQIVGIVTLTPHQRAPVAGSRYANKV